MTLTPAQAIIAKDLHRFRVLRCGRRFGKTSLMVEEIKGEAIAKPTRSCYIATTYQQARDIAWEMLLKELRGSIKKTNEARLEIKTHTLVGGESIIVLRGWESIENLRGQAFDFLGIDEIAMMRNFWVHWNEVLRPTLTDKKGKAFFSSTPKGYNHFFELCNKELEDNSFKTFHYTSYDNPHVPEEEIEAAKQSLPPDSFAQEYMAEFKRSKGLVYKEFNRKKHIYDIMPQGEFEKYAAIDFGYRNPAAVLHIYANKNMVYVDEEWYKSERTDAQIAEYAAAGSFISAFPDPENPGGIEELRRHGVNTREVMKGKGSVLKGIQKVREMLLNNKLKINKRCVNLIAEFEMYCYDDDKVDRNEKEEPLKANNHALDALRYFVMTYFKSNVVAEEQNMMAFKTRLQMKETR